MQRLFVSLLLTLAFPGLRCTMPAAAGDTHNSGKPKEIAMATKAAWTIEIETSGGFSGRGTGGVSLSSDGRAQASTETLTCQGRLTTAELKTIGRLIGRARPEKWRPSYTRPDNPHGRADQFRYTLSLSVSTEGNLKRYETFWYDETGGELPSDLRSLGEAVWAARERIIASCSP